MILERRYCIDILNQTKAVTSAIHSLESALLEKHLGHCVRQESFFSKISDEEEMELKIREIMEIFKKRLKQSLRAYISSIESRTKSKIPFLNSLLFIVFRAFITAPFLVSTKQDFQEMFPSL